ncbi:MAG TPA: bifunctional phosphopantothenoylcysteine decarboxylase/phosphopantothenate--cysteine ligase CoaBC [Methanospirillum sp.]|nr:bifunctional phosphopantothenoylcysteine decarboxylase/phosphopantothenate--cysteine ligase CoaBC [Methanospirillum sp.]
MNTLAGKLIILAVTGSIAAVETIKLVHALRRRGAMVQPVMSAAACGILHPDALTYACGRETITRITGLVEHVRYCGDEREGDLLLIAPCTANTISKIACSIDDTPVTTFTTTGLGSLMPVIVVPAMHHAMFRHPGLIKNLQTIQSWGVTTINPRIEEGKAKIAGIEEIVLFCERVLNIRPLEGKRILITSGRCEEPVDDVRVLTTRSSGKMGRELAKAAFRMGAEVTIVHRDNLPYVQNIIIDTADSMLLAVQGELAKGDVDVYISAAAVSDFAPVRYEGKIPSGIARSLSLVPLPKILSYAIGKAAVIVAFKLGTDSHEAAYLMTESGVHLIAANTPDTMGADQGQYILIDASGELIVSGQKEEIAHQIMDRITSRHLIPCPTSGEHV